MTKAEAADEEDGEEPAAAGKSCVDGAGLTVAAVVVFFFFFIKIKAGKVVIFHTWCVSQHGSDAKTDVKELQRSVFDKEKSTH